MLRLWVIRRSLHINKLHKNKKIIPYDSNFVVKILFWSTILHMLGGQLSVTGERMDTKYR